MRSLAVLATTAAVLGAAGCGGSSSKPKQDTAPAATTAAPSAAPAAKPKAATTAVSVKNFEFAPTTLTVKAGTKVTWKNGDATNHTVTFSGDGGAPASVDNLAQGASASRTFKTAGTYSYVCTFHPNMKAKVVVAK